MVLGPAAPHRCQPLDSAAARTGRPRRATAVRCSGNRFCRSSWWGYKVSPVKRTKFLSRTGRVSRIRFCKVRPTQGRGTPVTGSGVRPVEVEGTARGRFGLTPAILWFLSDRSERNSPRRAKSPTSKTLVPPAGDITQEAAGDDSPCQGEMSRRDKRGRDKFPPRWPQGAALQILTYRSGFGRAIRGPVPLIRHGFAVPPSPEGKAKRRLN